MKPNNETEHKSKTSEREFISELEDMVRKTLPTEEEVKSVGEMYKARSLEDNYKKPIWQ